MIRSRVSFIRAVVRFAAHSTYSSRVALLAGHGLQGFPVLGEDVADALHPHPPPENGPVAHAVDGPAVVFVPALEQCHARSLLDGNGLLPPTPPA
jgi:hypothetical protein